MKRKRLSAAAVDKAEQALDISCEAVESAVFGICDINRNVIKRLRMTADWTIYLVLCQALSHAEPPP